MLMCGDDMKRSLDVDVDENGQPVKAGEPKVSMKTGKRRVGKPREISLKKMEQICNIVRCGNYVKQSVLACGVNYNTFNNYITKGKKGIKPYDKYYEMLQVAKAGAEIDMSNRIHESAENGNVGADMWKLQRMFPNRWGNAQRQEIKVDNTQKIEIVKFSDKEKED